MPGEDSAAVARPPLPHPTPPHPTTLIIIISTPTPTLTCKRLLPDALKSAAYSVRSSSLPQPSSLICRGGEGEADDDKQGGGETQRHAIDGEKGVSPRNPLRVFVRGARATHPHPSLLTESKP